MDSTHLILDFWFGAEGGAGAGQPRDVWFRKDPAFDAEIARRFGPLMEAAALGDLEAWRTGALSALALVILLDQFPRNVHRGEPAAFAADAAALAVARHAVAHGLDQQVLPVQRWFFYLPFEHAEDLAAQDQSVRLFEALPEHPGREGVIDYAHRHRDVIRRFGRFPHRNAILARPSTPAEIEFLKQPGSSF